MPQPLKIERIDMSSQIIPVEPFDCVVFGGTGDLAERKLLPALYHRQVEGQFTEPTRIIGASRSVMTHEEYRKFAQDALKEHLKAGEYDDAQVTLFLNRLFYVPVDAKGSNGWDVLKKLLDEGKERIRAFIWPSRRAFSAISPTRFVSTSSSPARPASSLKSRSAVTSLPRRN